MISGIWEGLFHFLQCYLFCILLRGFPQSMEQITWNNWGKVKVSIKSISNSGSLPGPELAMENSEINEASICLSFNFSSP